MLREKKNRSLKRPHGLLAGYSSLLLLALALLIIHPSEARAEFKLRHVLGEKLAKMNQRLRSKIHWNDRRKFSMPIRGNQRKSLTRKRIDNGKVKINQKAIQQAKIEAARAAFNRATHFNRVTQEQYAAALRANIKKHYAAARHLEKRAKKQYKADGDLKKYTRRKLRAQSLRTRATDMKGELHLIRAWLRQEDNRRDKRIAQSRRNFRRHMDRAERHKNRQENTRASHPVQVIQTKLKVLSSKIEVLNAQANVARLEGDLVSAEQMKIEASKLFDQITQLKRELVDAEGRLASVVRTTPALSRGQRALDQFRKLHVTPKYLAGKFLSAVQLLKKYEMYGGAPALAGDAI